MNEAEVILKPEAKISTHFPKLEEEERTSLLLTIFVAPTVMADCSEAGSTFELESFEYLQSKHLHDHLLQKQQKELQLKQQQQLHRLAIVPCLLPETSFGSDKVKNKLLGNGRSAFIFNSIFNSSSNPKSKPYKKYSSRKKLRFNNSDNNKSNE